MCSSDLLRAVKRPMDERRFELATLAAARALGNAYCSLAHGTILCEKFFSAEQLTRIAEDFRTAGLPPADVAIMAFAERMARDASSITAEDVAGLRAHGLSEAEIFDVAAAAAARCFFAKMLDALGAQPDAIYQELEEGLRRRLAG